jgi:predicted AlkP superfamily pyrophosphatase or phosphodiesterase
MDSGASLTTSAAPADGTVEHVVLVSVDGLHPEAIRRLGPSGAPAFHRLIADGASTLNARTLVEATQTLPNHTGMVTGRPVSGAAGHGVTFNEDNGRSVQQSAGSYCAGIFDVVHDAGGTTALYAGKEKFDFLDRSWDGQHGAPDRTGADDGRDKIDTYLRADGQAETTALVRSLTTDPRDFSMIHFAAPDQAGHSSGWLSGPYVAAVRATDALIGDVLDTVAGSPELAASTVVLVTTDHGGQGHGHSDASRPADYTIPFFAWGAGVAQGADLYTLNPDRAVPGTSRPDYAATPPPIRNAEAGNLAADLLGLPPIAGSRINADQSLDLG